MFKISRRGPAVLGLLLASGLAAAVASQPGRPAASPMAAPAAGIEPGKAVMHRACQTCHGLEMITEARHTAKEWPSVIKRMRANGADLSDDETKQVQDYLIKAYAKGG